MPGLQPLWFCVTSLLVVRENLSKTTSEVLRQIVEVVAIVYFLALPAHQNCIYWRGNNGKTYFQPLPKLLKYFSKHFTKSLLEALPSTSLNQRSTL